MSETNKKIIRYESRECSSCSSELKLGARICPVCQRPQTKLSKIIRNAPHWISAIGLVLVAIGLMCTNNQLQLTQEQVRLQRMLSKPGLSEGIKVEILSDSTLRSDLSIKNYGASDAYNLNIKSIYSWDSLGVSIIGTASNKIGKLGKNETHSVPIDAREKKNWKQNFYIRVIVSFQWNGEVGTFEGINQRSLLTYDSSKNVHEVTIIDDIVWQGDVVGGWQTPSSTP